VNEPRRLVEAFLDNVKATMDAAEFRT